MGRHENSESNVHLYKVVAIGESLGNQSPEISQFLVFVFNYLQSPRIHRAGKELSFLLIRPYALHIQGFRTFTGPRAAITRTVIDQLQEDYP